MGYDLIIQTAYEYESSWQKHHGYNSNGLHGGTFMHRLFPDFLVPTGVLLSGKAKELHNIVRVRFRSIQAPLTRSSNLCARFETSSMEPLK